MQEGRIPPQSIEAELSVLGAMMLTANAATQALELLRAEDFYRQAHRAAFSAMEGLVRAGGPESRRQARTDEVPHCVLEGPGVRLQDFRCAPQM